MFLFLQKENLPDMRYPIMMKIEKSPFVLIVSCTKAFSLVTISVPIFQS